jgi:hypothetical protein
MCIWGRAQSAEVFDQAFLHDDVAGAQAFGSVYLALFPAYVSCRR